MIFYIGHSEFFVLVEILDHLASINISISALKKLFFFFVFCFFVLEKWPFYVKNH